MLQKFIGHKVKLSLHTFHGFRTVVGIVVNIEDNLIELDTFHGLEYFSLNYIVSISYVDKEDVE